MKLSTLLLCSALVWNSGLLRSQSTEKTSAQNACAVLQQALRLHGEIKIGMTRKEVEKLLRYDGGINSRVQGRFTYPGCDYIKMEIGFEPAPGPDNAFSPEDVVTSVSKLFIDYPVKD